MRAIDKRPTVRPAEELARDVNTSEPTLNQQANRDEEFPGTGTSGRSDPGVPKLSLLRAYRVIPVNSFLIAAGMFSSSAAMNSPTT